MKSPAFQHDEDGALYEEIEGERVVGDGEGDKKFVVTQELTPEELEKMGIEVNE